MLSDWIEFANVNTHENAIGILLADALCFCLALLWDIRVEYGTDDKRMPQGHRQYIDQHEEFGCTTLFSDLEPLNIWMLFSQD